MTPDLFQRTAEREGVRLTRYLDSRGIPTIGIGHNCAVDPAMAGVETITIAQAQALFAADSQKVISGLDRYLPWWRTLDDVRQDVMFDMAFNLGLGGFLEWHHTLADLQAHNYAQTAADMMASAWHGQVGRRAWADEAEMRTGAETKFPDPGTPPLRP